MLKNTIYKYYYRINIKINSYHVSHDDSHEPIIIVSIFFSLKFNLYVQGCLIEFYYFFDDFFAQYCYKNDIPLIF